MAKIIRYALTALLVFMLTDVVQGEDNKLLGLWECYKQDNHAPAPSCLYSMDFRDDGKMYQKWCEGRKIIVSKHRYSFTPDRIIIVNLSDNKEWSFEYFFLENGDLSLIIGPWDFKSFLTKNHEKIPHNYGCLYHSLCKQ